MSQSFFFFFFNKGPRFHFGMFEGLAVSWKSKAFPHSPNLNGQLCSAVQRSQMIYSEQQVFELHFLSLWQMSSIKCFI